MPAGARARKHDERAAERSTAPIHSDKVFNQPPSSRFAFPLATPGTRPAQLSAAKGYVTMLMQLALAPVEQVPREIKLAAALNFKNAVIHHWWQHGFEGTPDYFAEDERALSEYCW